MSDTTFTDWLDEIAAAEDNLNSVLQSAGLGPFNFPEKLTGRQMAILHRHFPSVVEKYQSNMVTGVAYLMTDDQRRIKRLEEMIEKVHAAITKATKASD